MKKFPVFFFALFLILSNFMFFACKKDAKEPQAPANSTQPPPPPPTPKPTKYFPVSSELKNWGLYQEGTYWIYQTDSVLPEFDSVYVTSVTSTTRSVAYTNDTTGIVEEIKVNLHHGAGYFFYDYFMLCSYQKELIIESDKHLAFFNLDTTQIASQYGTGFVVNHTVSNYSHYGVNYNSVRYVEWAYTVMYPSHPISYWGGVSVWKKNVGLIKDRNMPNTGNPVSLIRSHIVQ